VSASPQSIWINGDPHELSELARGDTGPDAKIPLSQLLTQLELGERRVAVALNRSVVPRSRYDDTAVQGGDRLEILEAVGGG